MFALIMAFLLLYAA
uniref:ATP synthase F0 subunit 9 n=1 Tax=Rhizopus oryzae TaxID=64495 RepID=Q3T4E7_RHIOR